ncbi:hypothetical protein NZD88_10175 [Chryseobacterium antibioticum]|uniref:Lipoprotein n=1 Tax=Chryseobacterium pyrolae TaxID=2987481 RepID=A0ABT2IGX7_9FLAO|nr:hypothetical protein [Chryseobacterium pyrolae]MCT2407905.1 hypothetical protein [Chryseobacterium pyrolae]
MNYYIFFLTLLGCILIFSCKDINEKGIRDFNKYSFDTAIEGEGSFNIGHVFNIDKKKYIEKNDYDFIYYTKDLTEREFLIPGSLTNDEFPVYWREVNLPFRIIKNSNSDTLIIIKENKKFIFKKVKNTSP